MSHIGEHRSYLRSADILRHRMENHDLTAAELDGLTRKYQELIEDAEQCWAAARMEAAYEVEDDEPDSDEF